MGGGIGGGVVVVVYDVPYSRMVVVRLRGRVLLRD